MSEILDIVSVAKVCLRRVALRLTQRKRNLGFRLLFLLHPELLSECIILSIFLKITHELVEAIRAEAIQLLDTESPEGLRSFLRYYIEYIKLKGDSLSIKFAFRESPQCTYDSSQVMVALGLDCTDRHIKQTSKFPGNFPLFNKIHYRDFYRR